MGNYINIHLKMCLMFGGGGLSKSMEPQFPPTKEAKMHKQRLLVVAGVHLMLALCMVFMTGGGGIYQLLTVLTLFCSTMNYSYCCLLFYIIYTGIDLLQNIEPIGLAVQRAVQSEPM